MADQSTAETTIPGMSEPLGPDEVIVPARLLEQVAALVRVIHERNTIEAHRDAMIERWLGWIASSWTARVIALVLSFRALFGVDVPTIIEWATALRVAV